MELDHKLNFCKKHYIKTKTELNENQKKQIDQKFNDPDYYFQSDDYIFIGKVLNNKHNDEILKKVILSSPVASRKNYRPHH